MNFIPRRPIHVAVDLPPARLAEPHLIEPLRRATSPAGPSWGGVLLLERHQAAPVTKALRTLVKAWPQGTRMLRCGSIRLPFGNLSEYQIRRFGEDYQGGHYLRIEAPTPPPVFDMRHGGIEFTGDVPPGSLVQCALTLFTTVGFAGQPAIGTEIEWLNLFHLCTTPWAQTSSNSSRLTTV